MSQPERAYPIGPEFEIEDGAEVMLGHILLSDSDTVPHVHIQLRTLQDNSSDVLVMQSIRPGGEVEGWTGTGYGLLVLPIEHEEGVVNGPSQDSEGCVATLYIIESLKEHHYRVRYVLTEEQHSHGVVAEVVRINKNNYEFEDTWDRQAIRQAIEDEGLPDDFPDILMTIDLHQTLRMYTSLETEGGEPLTAEHISNSPLIAA